jgi:hypothetical protein
MWVRQRSALQHWALDLIARLWESERWSAESCAELREHLYGLRTAPRGGLNEAAARVRPTGSGVPTFGREESPRALMSAHTNVRDKR